MASSDARFATCMALLVTLHDGVYAALQLGRGLSLQNASHDSNVRERSYIAN